MTFYIILAFAAFFISLLGTRLLILTLRNRMLLIDRPNLRSNHKTPTPRGGGLAVVMAMVICLLVADINYAVVLSLFLLAAVSLMDDLISIPAPVRLLVHILAVIISLSLVHEPVFGGYLPMWADKTLTVLLWVWFINLFNFMDGIDGISAVEMICIGFGLCFISALAEKFPDPLSAYSLIVCAAGFGFIWWNWHPAKIFLGDVGSVPIGFLLGYLLLQAILSGYGFAAIILPAYYLSDSTITLVRRAAQRKKIWQAHSEHYYQRAVRGGRRHDTVAKYVFGINLLLIMLAALSITDTQLGPIYVSVAYLSVFMVLGFFAHTPYNPDHEPL